MGETTTTKKELKNILINVRQAYRLLFIFQKQILNIVQLIQTAYELKLCDNKDSDGYRTEWGWRTNYINEPTSKYNLEYSAWDFLPMYFSEFRFCLPKDDQQFFSVIIVTDDGWFKKNLSKKVLDEIDFLSEIDDKKEDLKNYESVEKSGTFLIFLAEQLKEKKGQSKLLKEYGGGWQWRHYPEFFTNTEGGGKEEKYYWKKYDLSEFYDIDSTNKILKEFADKAREAGFQNIKFELK